jgi:hypothetical protein
MCSLHESDSSENEAPVVYHDTEFVKSKFPLLKIESVKYCWYDIGIGKDDRLSVGPTPIKCFGIIEIGDDFAREIDSKYKWRDSKKKIPEILSDGKSYSFRYSEEFEEEYFTDSFVGYFYFDSENKTLYFDGEY